MSFFLKFRFIVNQKELITVSVEYSNYIVKEYRYYSTVVDITVSTVLYCIRQVPLL